MAVFRLLTRGPASDGYDIFSTILVLKFKSIFGYDVTYPPSSVAENHPTRILYSLISALLSLITSLNTVITGFMVSFACAFAFVYYLSKLSEKIGYNADDSFVILVAAITVPAFSKALASITPDLMGTLFSLMCLYYYFRYDKEKSIKFLIFSYILVFGAFFCREALILLILVLFLYPTENLSIVQRFSLFILPGVLGIIGISIIFPSSNIVQYSIQFLPMKVIADLLHREFLAAFQFLLWEKWFDFLFLAFFESIAYSIGLPLIFSFFKFFGRSNEFVLEKRSLFLIWGLIYIFFYLFIYLGIPVGRIWLPILVSALVFLPEGIEQFGKLLRIEQKRARTLSLLIFIIFGVVITIARIFAGILGISFNWRLYP